MKRMNHIYDNHFMAYTEASSRHAARQVTTRLCEELSIDSVMDIGCATGTWLGAWGQAGVQDIQGVDGDYVDRTRLAIPTALFLNADLSMPLNLTRTFDLVQSLEVAEHIDPKHAEQFVENIVRHSRGLILFSAAPPGQGGEFHVNEQPYEYWRKLFAKHGYVPFDPVRPWLAGDASISFWYRFNILLYVRRDLEGGLPMSIAETRIADASSVADVSPPLFRARKMLVRSLPYPIQQGLARFKARLFPTGRF